MRRSPPPRARASRPRRGRCSSKMVLVPPVLNLVSVFTRVVEQGSFTAAAAALHIPKSSVRRAVSRLEETLGVRLLQRTTRKLGLTQAGERHLPEGRGPLGR